MDKLPVVKFDIRGTNPVNRIPLEKIPIKDKTCPWVIPNGSPFFAENELVTVYNQVGGKLIFGTHYTFDNEFPPFCEITGRKICCFIKLDEKVRNENTFISVTYQSIGAWFVPRNSIEQWLFEITQGKIPIPWEKVFNVPPELPPSFHSHNIKTEIGDWYELTFFFDYMANIYSTRDSTVYENADQVINESFNQLQTVKAAQLAKIAAHDRNYNDPHGTTKWHLDLGNLDNFRTATEAQDVAGTAANLFSTPMGVLELSEAFQPVTDSVMRSGVLPISYFGGDSFIPPLIAGSFEGIGSQIESTGVCLEPTGQVMILGNHFDGRVDGLYFTVVENHRSASPKVTYTGYQYNPPDLESRGFLPNRIICGSGNFGIMVGRDGTDDWYVALTNNTFSPSAHRYVKCDMTAVKAIQGLGVWSTYNVATLVDGGDYLLLMAAIGNYQTNERFAFFRVKKADIRAQINVTWELIKVTYTDYDEVAHNNADFVQPFTFVKNGNGEVTRSGPWSFRQGATGWYRSGKPQAWGMQYVAGQIVLHIMFYYVFTRDGAGIGVISDTMYNFNPTTGALTTLSKTANLDMGFTDTTSAERYAYLQENYGPFRYIGGLGLLHCALLPDASLVIPFPYNSNLFPLYVNRCVFSGYTKLEDLLVRPLSVQSIGGLNGLLDTANKVNLPTVSGTYPCSMVYETDGELFTANDPTDNIRKTFVRKVTGDYLVRPTVSNLKVSPLKSRPLTNDIYLTNMVPYDGVVGCTGTAAQLAAGGVESGSLSLSACHWTSTPGYQPGPITAALRAPSANNMLVSFPRTHSRVLDPTTRTATYKGETFYGLRQGSLDAIKGFIPAAYRDSTPSWCFTLQMLEGINGGMFHDLSFGVLSISYYSVTNDQIRIQMVLVRLVTEAPGGDHPSAYLVTGFTALDQPGDVLSLNGAATSNRDFWTNGQLRAKPMLSCYREDGKLKCYNTNAFGGNAANTSRIRTMLVFDINLSNNKIENIAQVSNGWNVEDLVTMIPKVGLTDGNFAYNNREAITTGVMAIYPFEYTGGAASLYKKGTDYYLAESAYPETGWVIYFPENIRLLVQGTSYRTLGGSIDLRDIDTDPRNKVYYIYATIEGSVPKYILSTIKLRRGNAMLLVSKITTNETQIVTIERLQPFVVGDFELSYVRDGGIIPVSTGFPQDEGVFRFLSSSELLP